MLLWSFHSQRILHICVPCYVYQFYAHFRKIFPKNLSVYLCYGTQYFRPSPHYSKHLPDISGQARLPLSEAKIPFGKFAKNFLGHSGSIHYLSFPQMMKNGIGMKGNGRVKSRMGFRLNQLNTPVLKSCLQRRTDSSVHQGKPDFSSGMLGTFT